MSHDHALLRPPTHQSTSAPAPAHEAPGERGDRLAQGTSALSNQFLAALQPKLRVGQPNDAYEQEADAMAERVLGAGAAEPGTAPLAPQVTPLIQRAPAPDQKKKPSATQPPVKKPEPAATKQPAAPGKQEPGKKKTEEPAAKKLQRTPVGKVPDEPGDERKKLQKSGGPGGVSATTERDIESSAGSGSRLDAASAAFFGERFGTDFSAVRIHNDAAAARLARSVNAVAFTHGADIYFDAGRFEPGTASGRRLLAHELTHTIQQGAVPRSAAVLTGGQTGARSTAAGPGAGGPATPSPSATVPTTTAPTTTAPRTTSPAISGSPLASGRNASSGKTPGPSIQRTEETETAPAPAESLDAENAPPLPADEFDLLRAAIESQSPGFSPNVGRFIGPDIILFNEVAVPSYKKDPAMLNSLNAAPFDRSYASAGKFGRASSYSRGSEGNTQRRVWKNSITRDAIMNDLTTKAEIASHGAAPASTSYQATVALRGGQSIGTRVGRRAAGAGLAYLGTKEQLAEVFTTPAWTNSGIPVSYRRMEVEHLVELQIGNWRNGHLGGANPNERDNMILLARGINADAGRFIQRDIIARLTAFINHPGIGSSLPGATSPATVPTPATPTGAAATPSTTAAPVAALSPGKMASAIKSIKHHYNVEFTGARASAAPGMPDNLSPGDHWSAHEVESAEHMDAVAVSTLDELGSAEQLYVFTSASGGFYRPFAIDENTNHSGERHFFGRSFPLHTKTLYMNAINNIDVSGTAELGVLKARLSVPAIDGDASGQGTTQQAPAAPSEPPTFDFPLQRMPGARYAAYINSEALRQWNRGRIKGASPITIDDVDIDADGISLTGHVITDIPLLRGSRIDFALNGTELSASKTFSAAEVQLPAPFSISALALTMSASTRDGLSADGRMDFGIERVGTGFLAARASTGRRSRGGGFSLTGGFDFDTRLFDPARITLSYADGELSGEGHLGIPAGRIRGIASADLHLAYAPGGFTAQGLVRPDIPGVQEGSLSLVYSEAEGLVIAGTLTLAPNPAIRGGSLAARVERGPDGNYKVAASGTAQPAIPNVDAQLAVNYDDGAFDASVQAGFSRGLLAGQLRVAATNRPIDPVSGEPAGEPGPEITVYGGGLMTVRFTPWLAGTVGIRLLPNGEIELRGEVVLPQALTVFERRELEKNIFRLNLDIPIVGVSILGQNVGIFATIGGGLDVSAGIGPGQLTGLSLGVTYNPDHEDQTLIHGTGEFVIPADASLRLAIRGGIGAGIPVVSARAGLQVTGSLALAGEARAAATVDWTPGTGIALEAMGSVFVEPRLIFDVSAFVEVTADLVFDTVELYSESWNLAHAEYGSGLRFGVQFPIHYSSGQPFNLSLDDVVFTVPDIAPLDVLGNLLGIGS